MALRDTSCYTLELVPNRDDPEVLEAVEGGSSASGRGGSGSGAGQEARYARVKERRAGEGYSAVIYDAVTGAKLASTGMGKEKDRKRRLELHGPDEAVGNEWEGMINFGWNFYFEGNKYHWTREVYGKDYICTLDRKPDPAVEVCLARSASKLDNARIQILHYNIDRFPESIKDLRGLETLLVTTLISFLDIASLHARSTSSAAKAVSDPGPLGELVLPAGSALSAAAPSRPKPPERIITPEDYEPEAPNEVVVGLHTSIDEHVARAVHLLEDPHVLFIVVRTRSPLAAQRALEVALGVKRVRHREGLDDLHQYVVEEADWAPKPQPKPEAEGREGRRRPEVINLNVPGRAPATLGQPRPPVSPGSDPLVPKTNGASSADGKKEWSPPPNISVYLSTILLPDLTRGKRTPSPVPPRSGNGAGAVPIATAPQGMGTTGPGKQSQPGQGPISINEGSSSGGVLKGGSLSGGSLTRLFTRKKS